MTTAIALVKYENKLVEALATTDLRKLSEDLKRYRILTSKMMETMASLDHKRLNSQSIARYLLKLVSVRTKADNTICSKFLTFLSEVDNLRVAQVGRALVQLYPAQSQDVTPTDLTVGRLSGDHVGYLMEILSEVSYKWEEISIALGLPKASIEESKGANTNTLKLYRSLTEWVHGNHIQARPPTMTALKEALASNTVQQPRLAEEIEERMKRTISSSIPSLITDTHTHDPLAIQYESIDTEVADGNSALLEVQVTPSDSTFQWMKDGQPLSESSAFSGTSTDMLLINAVGQISEGKYCCQVSRGLEQLTSSVVTLTIKYHEGKKCLLNLYKFLNEPQDSWPLITGNIFVNLSLVRAIKVKSDEHNFSVEGEIEDVLVKRKRIDYKRAFGKYKKGFLVLVEGRPGSGKTTLAHKITKDWAKGLILQDAKMVFLISLRRVRNMQSNLFGNFFQNQSKKLRRKIEKSSGDRICFILDGYDEYCPKTEDKSNINDIIQKNYLPLAMVIITSRPVATAALQPKASLRIEILGFTKEKFNAFVKQFPFKTYMDSKKAGISKSKLTTYLKTCSNVLNMCYLPINACIICFLFCQNLGDKLPKTETEVYDTLVKSLILRKLKLNDSSATLHSLQGLNGDDRELFKKICLLAFNMTIENKQIIHELPVSLDSLNKSPFSGLFTVDRTDKIFVFEESLSFLHLTLQEFLAASHLANLDEDKQLEVITDCNLENRFFTMLKFYCGITKLLKASEFLNHMYQCSNVYLLFHCAYEAQNKAVCCSIIELLHGEVRIESAVLTPADFVALGYVISTASSLITKIEIYPCLLYEDYLGNHLKDKELDKTDPLSFSFVSTGSISVSGSILCLEDLICTHISYHQKTNFDGAVRNFNELMTGGSRYLRNASCTSTSVTTLLDFPSDILNADSAVPLVNALQVCDKILEIGIRTARIISSILKKNCKQLQTLMIYSAIPTTSVVDLAAGFKYCQQLEILDMMCLNLCTDGAVALSKGLAHCCELKMLDLIDCNISPEGAEALAIALQDINLEALNLTRNNIGDKGTLAIARKSHSKRLFLNKNNIGSMGIKVLAEEMVLSLRLVELGLCENNIDSSSSLFLAHGLTFCFYLIGLSLSDIDIASNSGVALVKGLKSCTLLKYLFLENCKLGTGGAVVVTESFSCWTNLITFNMSNCGLNDCVVALLAAKLQHLTCLEALELSNNDINSHGAVAIAEGLQHCPCLHTLDVSKNCIGSTGMVALAKQLKYNPLKYLDLSHNQIDGKGIEILATLKHFDAPHMPLDIMQYIFDDNTIDMVANLASSVFAIKVDLSHNKIDSTGALCLLTELLSNKHFIRFNLLANNISTKALAFLSTLERRNIYRSVLLNTSQRTHAS